MLPLPSIEVLAEAAAGSQSRTSIVIHVLESFVVTWMKLIKVLCDGTSTICIFVGLVIIGNSIINILIPCPANPKLIHLWLL